MMDHQGERDLNITAGGISPLVPWPLTRCGHRGPGLAIFTLRTCHETTDPGTEKEQ